MPTRLGTSFGDALVVAVWRSVDLVSSSRSGGRRGWDGGRRLRCCRSLSKNGMHASWNRGGGWATGVLLFVPELLGSSKSYFLGSPTRGTVKPQLAFPCQAQAWLKTFVTPTSLGLLITDHRHSTEEKYRRRLSSRTGVFVRSVCLVLLYLFAALLKESTRCALIAEHTRSAIPLNVCPRISRSVFAVGTCFRDPLRHSGLAELGK